MSALDEILHANSSYAAGFGGPPGKLPSRAVTVIACMDTRLDLLGALGLEVGEAHILRNAGGLITEDVLRSLAISQRHLGTREVAILHHTDCGMTGFDDAGFRAELAAESGSTPAWDVPGFTDAAAQVRDSVAVVRECPWLPHRDEVRGFVFDVAAGRLSEV